MKRFKKPKYKTFTYKEARDRALLCIKMSMVTQLAAAVDTSDLNREQMIALMERAIYYDEHIEEERAKLDDLSDTIYKATNIDIRLGEHTGFDEVVPMALRFWTPMIARKPGDKEWVLANYADGTMGLDRRCDNPEFDNDVVAWMYLPAPYVEED